MQTKTNSVIKRVVDAVPFLYGLISINVIWTVSKLVVKF